MFVYVHLTPKMFYQNEITGLWITVRFTANKRSKHHPIQYWFRLLSNNHIFKCTNIYKIYFNIYWFTFIGKVYFSWYRPINNANRIDLNPSVSDLFAVIDIENIFYVYQVKLRLRIKQSDTYFASVGHWLRWFSINLQQVFSLFILNIKRKRDFCMKRKLRHHWEKELMPITDFVTYGFITFL
jgi:hypothetical protein